ncbi:MAG TPA: hypothetical protein VMD59_00175 [Acidimicrobiales bacterium]|nr:hypothetical protein [Acidimicrobiales bacterium]
MHTLLPRRMATSLVVATMSALAAPALAGGAVAGAAAGAAPPRAARPAVLESARPGVAGASGCSLPLVRDVYDGFELGVPSGWDLSTLDGEIALSPDASGTEGAILYPALLTKGVTAASLFSGLMAYEKSSLVKDGASVVETAGHGPLPGATLTVRVGSTVLAGSASVRVVPVAAESASELGVFSLVWAPRASYRALAPTLSAISACYAPVRADLFQLFRTNPYTFVMPPGWKVSADETNALELTGFHNAASVVYELWGPYEAGVNISQAITGPADAIKLLFGQYHLTITQVLTSDVLPNVQTSDGVEGQEYLEFDATLQGKALHGIAYVETNVNGGSAAGVIRLGLATAALWNSVNGGLIEMMGSIQHNFSQDLQEIQSINQQWQDFSGQVENFDDTLNSQQLVEDPTTGTLYEAPYSSWDADGPNGAGYYLPNGQLLNQVERS